MRWLLILPIVLGMIGYGVLQFDPAMEVPLDAAMPQTTIDRAIRADVQASTSAGAVNGQIRQALADDDYDTALVYADLADFAGFDLTEDTQAALRRAGGITQTAFRNTRDFAFSFVTGEADSLAGLSGVVVSDLTLAGDIRDLSQEGGKMVAGEPYNELLLGLSVVGIGVTGTTIATGGTTLTGRVGVSLMKVSVKAGTLTADFTRTMGRLVGDAVNMPLLRRTLQSVDMTNTRATREAMQAYSRNIRGAELFPVMNRMNDMRLSAGAPEAVRMMRYVDTTEDLTDVATLSQRLGRKTRGVMSATGKTALRAFKVTLNLAEWILRNILAFASWLGSLVTMAFGRRGFGLVRLLRR